MGKKGREYIRTKRSYEVLAKKTEEIGLECHAGHGLNFETAKEIAAIPQIIELNIGHFLIGEAIFIGLENTIKKMKELTS